MKSISLANPSLSRTKHAFITARNMVTAIAFNWRILRFIVIKTAFIVAFLVPHGKPNNIFEQDKQELFIMNKMRRY